MSNADGVRSSRVRAIWWGDGRGHPWSAVRRWEVTYTLAMSWPEQRHITTTRVYDDHAEAIYRAISWTHDCGCRPGLPVMGWAEFRSMPCLRNEAAAWDGLSERARSFARSLREVLA